MSAEKPISSRFIPRKAELPPAADEQASPLGKEANAPRVTLTPGPSALRSWVFRLTAVCLVPALFFLTVEMVLRTAGAGYPAAFVVPSDAKPGYLVDNYKFAWRFFPRSLARSSQPILITKKKRPETKRVIVLGGSAAMGDPEPAYGFPRVLQALLELQYPERDFEVINAAVTAINSHVVLPIVRDCRDLGADAWVIYLGNNEVHGPYGAGTVFGGSDTPLWVIRWSLSLKRTRTGQFLSAAWPGTPSAAPKSWGGMKMFLDHQVRHDDPSLRHVYDYFRANLSDILGTATKGGVPVVISTVVSNLKDCGPFASLHSKSLSGQQQDQWQVLFQRGCDAQAAGRWEEAIALLEQARHVDAEFAELSFRLGQCLLQAGRASEARERFQQARDLDGLRFRADSTINQIITSTAEQRANEAVHLIDAERQFARRSPGGITGDEFLYEHVHLNLAGNYLLARLVAEQLAPVLHLSGAGPSHDTWPTAAACAERLGLTAYHRHLIAKELQTRFHSPPFDRQVNRQARDAKLQAQLSRLAAELTPDASRVAVAKLRQLLDSHPSDWVLRKQFGELLESTGDLEGAIAQWSKVTDQLPQYAEGFYKLGTLWNRAKKWDEAEQALRTALALHPGYARALNSLGICLSHQDRFDESFDQFRKAVAFRPSYAEAYMNWGLVLKTQGDVERALDRYHRALQADPDYLPAHVQLGKFYVGQKQYEAAEPHYRQVARLKPRDAAAHLNLGLLQMKMNQPARAAAQFQRALELDPGNRIARQALVRARQLGG